MKTILFRLAKLLLISLGAIFSIVLLLVGLFFLLPGGCVNEELSTIDSPDRKYKMVLFRRSCGATTGENVQASVLRKDETLGNGDGGNIFIESGSYPVVATWKSEKSVLIKHTSKAHVFKASRSIWMSELPWFVEIKIDYSSNE